MRNLFLYVSVAAFTFAGTCIYADQGAPVAAPAVTISDAYSLVIERDGQAYVADYNLTLSDCAASMQALQHIKPKAWPACERQPQGLIGEGA